jgi:hypothetical protein
MKRKLYNLCTLASLLLLCGSLWWWNHSSRNTDQVTLHGVGGTSVQVTGSGGQVMLTKAVSNDADGGNLSWKSSAQGGEPKLLATSFNFNNHPQNGMTLVLPSWALALVFAVLPSLWIYSKVHGKGGKKKPAEAH